MTVFNALFTLISFCGMVFFLIWLIVFPAYLNPAPLSERVHTPGPALTTKPVEEKPYFPYSSYRCSGPNEGNDAYLFRTCVFDNLYYVPGYTELFFYPHPSREYWLTPDYFQSYLSTMNRVTGIDGSADEWGHRWSPVPYRWFGKIYSVKNRSYDPFVIDQHIVYFEPGAPNNFGHALMDDILPVFMAYDRVVGFDGLLPAPLMLTMLEHRTTMPSLERKMSREWISPFFGTPLDEYCASQSSESRVFRLSKVVAGMGTLADHPYEKLWDSYANGRKREALNFLHGYSGAWKRVFHWLILDTEWIITSPKPECRVVFLNRGRSGLRAPLVKDFASFAQQFSNVSTSVITPEAMTISDQAMVVAQAHVVVGNCGGGSTLALFTGLKRLDVVDQPASVVLFCGGSDGRLDYMSFEEASWATPFYYDAPFSDHGVDEQAAIAVIDRAISYSCPHLTVGALHPSRSLPLEQAQQLEQAPPADLDSDTDDSPHL